jgi:hypothetical protein
MSAQRTRFDVTWSSYRNSDPKQGSGLVATNYGLATNVSGLKTMAYQFEWTASFPAATIAFEVSNKANPTLTSSTDWVALSSSMIANYSVINPTGATVAGNSYVILDTMGSAWIRPTVTIAAGSTAAQTIYAYGNARGG